MKVYIDSEYACYTSPSEDRREVETNAFDGKCTTFIEGYRYIPSGETWTRADGEVFTGEAVFPCKPYEQLAVAQSAYEEAETVMLSDIETSYMEGVNSI